MSRGAHWLLCCPLRSVCWLSLSVRKKKSANEELSLHNNISSPYCNFEIKCLMFWEKKTLSFPFSSFLLTQFHISANWIKSEQLNSLSAPLLPHSSTRFYSVREVSFSSNGSYETPYYTEVESNEMIMCWCFVFKRSKVNLTMTKIIFSKKTSVAQEQQLHTGVQHHRYTDWWRIKQRLIEIIAFIRDKSNVPVW